MSDSKKPADASGDEPEDTRDKPTIAPFVAAFVIVALVVIGILVINQLSGSESTPEQLITRAVIGQNDALQREDYTTFREYTCAAAQGDEAGVIAAQKESVEKQGERFVDAVADVRVDGDRATAAVTYSFKDSRDDKATSDVPLVSEDGAWKVCEV